MPRKSKKQRTFSQNITNWRKLNNSASSLSDISVSEQEEEGEKNKAAASPNITVLENVLIRPECSHTVEATTQDQLSAVSSPGTVTSDSGVKVPRKRGRPPKAAAWQKNKKLRHGEGDVDKSQSVQSPIQVPTKDMLSGRTMEDGNFLHGTLNQNSVQVSAESRGKMCTACAIVAVCISSQVNLNDWTREHVDGVIRVGDMLYQQCIRERRRFAPRVTHPYLALDEVLHESCSTIKMNMFPLTFRLTEVFDSTVQGHLRVVSNEMPTLREGLIQFLSTDVDVRGLIICGSQTMALAKIGMGTEVEYALIDSHPRPGLASGKTEAFILRTRTLDKLISFLLQIFGSQGDGTLYTLSVINVETGDFDVSPDFAFNYVERRRSQRIAQSSQMTQSVPAAVHPVAKRGRGRPKKNTQPDCAPTATGNSSYLGRMTNVCKFCRAMKFPNETALGCCKNGQVDLPPLGDYPELCKALLTNCHPKSKPFMRLIRAYNSTLAMATVSANYDDVPGHGPPVIKISGVFHHKIGGPREDNTRYGAIYFCAGTGDASCENVTLDPSLLAQLRDEIVQVNPYAKVYKSMGNKIAEYVQTDNADLCIDLVLFPHVDRNRYNVPTDPNEIGAVFLSSDGQVPEMKEGSLRMYYCDDRRRQREESEETERQRTVDLTRLSPLTDPLCYPLLFPRGELGWEINTPLKGATGKRKRVSMREFHVYRFQIRLPKFNPILNAGKASLQYEIDVNVRIEGDRLTFIRKNQELLRVCDYQGVTDYVLRRLEGESELIDIGRQYILPSTFQGGHRFMIGAYQDSMAMVAKFGKPTYFITVTCNARWVEIQENLASHQVYSDRPDLLVRVFKLKLDMLMKDLLQGDVFGKPICWVYVIEFQKRGLPHAHISLTVEESRVPQSPEDIDRVISAEIPDEATEPELRGLVLEMMVHGPCGDCNPQCPCMVDGKCKKKYPYSFSEHTVLRRGAAIYRRRQTSERVTIRRHEVDNRWIVPYNPQILLKYKAHINVLIVQNPGCVKYIHKYITKGHDAALFRIRQQGESVLYDEIEDYVNSRYVSSCESMWRIFGFPLVKKSHTVVRLPVHLPNEKTVYFHENDDVDVLIDQAQKKVSLLEEYFKLNDRDSDARQLYYVQIPEYYTFRNGTWNRRQRRAQCIGRIYSISPRYVEKFHLRILLLHVKGSTSYEDLLNPRDGDPLPCTSFRESARRRLLIGGDDTEWERTLAECAATQVAGQVRKVFAYLMCFADIVQPRQLYDKFRMELMEDYIRRRLSEGESEKRSLLRIETFMRYMDNSLSRYDSFADLLAQFDIDGTIQRQDLVYNGESVEEAVIEEEREERFEAEAVRRMEMALEVEREESLLNVQQRPVYELLSDAVLNDQRTDSNEAKCYYLQGAGGTGKTFLYNVLLKRLESLGVTSLAVAHTGIAALLLRNGRTAHSTFRLPLDITETSTSAIYKGTHEAERIKRARLIVWDEISMTSFHAINTVDRLLRDLHGKNDIPFGGVCVLLGGDLRQLLPIDQGNSVQMQNTFMNCTAWHAFRVFELTQNMRVEPGAERFAEWLVQLGNGTLKPDRSLINVLPDYSYQIQVPDECVTENVVDDLYGDIFELGAEDRERVLEERMILCSLNATCDTINDRLVDHLPGDLIVSKSVDSVESDDINDKLNYSEELLNTKNFSGLPKHELRLKIGVPVILLRNISVADGLVNGTRMIVKAVSPLLLTIEILTGTHRGERHVIPRMDLSSRDVHFPVTLKRRQFPVKVCFAMTINKAQGQTFRRIGIFLPTPVFAFGQLYVAFSRTVSFASVRVQVEDTPKQGRLIQGDRRVFTKNYAPYELLKRLRQCQRRDQLGTYLLNTVNDESTFIKVEEIIEENPDETTKDPFEDIDYVEDQRYQTENWDSSDAFTNGNQSEKPISSENSCEFCSKSFSTQSSAKRHIKKVHTTQISSKKRAEIPLKKKKKTYACDLCEMVFSAPQTLGHHKTKEHYLTINTDNPNMCIVCSKTFNTRTNLKRHINAVHVGIKNFSCKVCDKKFTTKITRDEHMNIHISNKPYTCDICGEKFNHNSGLRQHKRRHFPVIEKPKKEEALTHCDTCNKPFKYVNNLKRHVETVHLKIRKYGCEVCDARFGTNFARNDHMLTRHKKLPKIKIRKA